MLQETKIPTCVGIAETKTKAKLANFLAKKRPEFGGVCDLRDPIACARLYPTIPLPHIRLNQGLTRVCSRYLKASMMRAKLRKPIKSTSSFSKREKILRKPLSLRNSRSISLRFL